MKQKATPNLKDAKAETMVARPSRITYGTHEMLTFLDVKGAATEASASDNEMPAYEKLKSILFDIYGKHLWKIPACAVFKAPQSLQPSPHIIT